MIRKFLSLFRRRKCEICGQRADFTKIQVYLKAVGERVVMWDESIDLCGACLQEAIELEEAEVE